MGIYRLGCRRHCSVDFFNAIIAKYPTFVEAVQTESAGSNFFEMMESFNSLLEHWC